MLSFFNKYRSAIAAFVLLLSACNKEKSPLEFPSTYDGAPFSANVATEDAVRNQLEALVNEAKKGRTQGAVVDYSTLTSLYSTGSPSLNSLTTTYFKDRLEGAGNWLEELAKASGGNYTPGTPAAQGGTFGGYLFDENGLELEQLVDKGLFGAALYHHAVAIQQEGNWTPAQVDRLVRIFGAHPDFPNTPTATKAANPDKFMANYAARRDKNDGKGLYSQMKTAFIQLQAAVKAGDDYQAERDEALATIRLTWEKVNAGTIINYCHSVITTLSATNPTEADQARALHAYSEMVGFIHGWRTIPAGFKQITDSEIDNILVLLNAPYNGTPTSYKFVTDPVNELPKLVQLIDLLQNEYGFTDQEIEDFKKNWVAEQGR